jgi:hypothetical protein
MRAFAADLQEVAMKRCPKCNSLMPDDVALCIRCGFDSQASSAPAARQTPLPAAAPEMLQATAAEAGADAPKQGRIRRGWTLAKQSLRVLTLDKELLVFPLLSGISCFLLLASFVAGVWATRPPGGDGPAGRDVSWVLVFAYYLANYFVIVFFNSALVACALIRFRGGDPKLADGLRAARAHLKQIAAWALLAASVGMLLKTIEERVGFVGRIVTALLGAAWTIGSYFVVPVLVAENMGPLDAFRRSVLILRKAWGESLVGNIGLGLITTLVTAALLILVGLASAFLAATLGSAVVMLAGIVLMVLIVVLAALVGSALHAIVLSALYLYATEGKVPQAFAGVRLREAFVAK